MNSVRLIECPGGLRYLIPNETDEIGRSIIADGEYDREGHFVCERIIEAFLKSSGAPSFSVFDIGANIGTFTIPMARRYPQASFYCFEPQRHIANLLCGNAALNLVDVDGRIRVIRDGVSDKVQQRVVSLPDYATCANTGAFSVQHNGNAVSHPSWSIIRCVSLDHWYAESGVSHPVALVKIDVEGGEFDVLSGALLFLSICWYPTLFFECRTRVPETEFELGRITTLLNSMGYTLDVLKNNHVARHKSHPEIPRFYVDAQTDETRVS